MIVAMAIFHSVIPVLFILTLRTVLDGSDYLILDGTDLFRMIQVYIALINETVLVIYATLHCHTIVQILNRVVCK